MPPSPPPEALYFVTRWRPAEDSTPRPKKRLLPCPMPIQPTNGRPMIDARPFTPTVLLALALAGCAATGPTPVPLVAYPGPGKTAEAAGQDDEACHREAAAPATITPATITPANSGVPGGKAAGEAATGPAPPGPAGSILPGEVYLRCMEARGNILAPAHSVPT